jgi:hypothetical protein
MESFLTGYSTYLCNTNIPVISKGYPNPSHDHICLYKDGPFKDNVNFKLVRKPHRFKDEAKYSHCLDLLEAVVT